MPLFLIHNSLPIFSLIKANRLIPSSLFSSASLFSLELLKDCPSFSKLNYSYVNNWFFQFASLANQVTHLLINWDTECFSLLILLPLSPHPQVFWAKWNIALVSNLYEVKVNFFSNSCNEENLHFFFSWNFSFCCLFSFYIFVFVLPLSFLLACVLQNWLLNSAWFADSLI